jgi:hypothetical protein
MADLVISRRTRIVAYVAVSIGLLAFCCAALLGAMGIDFHLTESYFEVAHLNWLTPPRFFCLAIGIAGVAALARTLYARYIDS